MQKNEPAEIERLGLLTEELGESNQIVGKILRHGIDSCHPVNGISNKELLEKELGDVVAVMFLMIYNKDLDVDAIEAAMKDKLTKFRDGRGYLHHQTFESDWPY